MVGTSNLIRYLKWPLIITFRTGKVQNLYSRDRKYTSSEINPIKRTTGKNLLKTLLKELHNPNLVSLTCNASSDGISSTIKTRINSNLATLNYDSPYDDLTEDECDMLELHRSLLVSKGPIKMLVTVTVAFMGNIVHGGLKPTYNWGASPCESSDFLIIASLLDTCSIGFSPAEQPMQAT